jgi:hypothetical protein
MVMFTLELVTIAQLTVIFVITIVTTLEIALLFVPDVMNHYI